ncbi:MAG: hypothetical protein ACHQ03_00960 [Candidatus Bathyarchaeia archaeon]
MSKEKEPQGRTRRSNSERIQKAKLFYDYSVQANTWLRDANANISSKLSNLVALQTGILAILFGSTYFVIQQATTSAPSVLVVLLLIASFIVFFIALVTSLFHYRPIEFNFSHPQLLIDGLKSTTYEIALEQIVRSVAKMITSNIKTTNARSSGLQRAMQITCVGFLPLIAVIVILALDLFLSLHSGSGSTTCPSLQF